MLELEDMERMARLALNPHAGLVVFTSIEDGYLTLIIRKTSVSTGVAYPERVQAKIETSGAEMFLLNLDGEYEYREFDWEPAGQRETLEFMTKLAEVYLAGEGRETQRHGIFGRIHREFILELRNASYVFSSR